MPARLSTSLRVPRLARQRCRRPRSVGGALAPLLLVTQVFGASASAVQEAARSAALKEESTCPLLTGSLRVARQLCQNLGRERNTPTCRAGRRGVHAPPRGVAWRDCGRT